MGQTILAVAGLGTGRSSGFLKLAGNQVTIRLKAVGTTELLKEVNLKNQHILKLLVLIKSSDIRL